MSLGNTSPSVDRRACGVTTTLSVKAATDQLAVVAEEMSPCLLSIFLITIRRFEQGCVTEFLPDSRGKSVSSELTSKGVVGRGLRGCELITAPQG